MSAGTTSATVRERAAVREVSAPPPVASPAAAPVEQAVPVNPPVYWGDRWGLMIWLTGAAVLAFLHVTSHIAPILR
jgi:hypothetical protein